MMDEDRIAYERCHSCDQLNPTGWRCNNPNCYDRPDTYEDCAFIASIALVLGVILLIAAILMGLAR